MASHLVASQLRHLALLCKAAQMRLLQVWRAQLRLQRWCQQRCTGPGRCLGTRRQAHQLVHGGQACTPGQQLPAALQAQAGPGCAVRAPLHRSRQLQRARLQARALALLELDLLAHLHAEQSSGIWECSSTCLNCWVHIRTTLLQALHARVGEKWRTHSWRIELRSAHRLVVVRRERCKHWRRVHLGRGPPHRHAWIAQPEAAPPQPAGAQEHSIAQASAGSQVPLAAEHHVHAAVVFQERMVAGASAGTQVPLLAWALASRTAPLLADDSACNPVPLLAAAGAGSRLTAQPEGCRARVQGQTPRAWRSPAWSDRARPTDAI
jgi:hypothetical protein